MRTGTCDSDSSGHSRARGHSVLPALPCPAWPEAAGPCTGRGGSRCPPQCPPHPGASGNRGRATKPGCPWLPSAARGWGTGQCQLWAEAARAGGPLPRLGTGGDTLGTRGDTLGTGGDTLGTCPVSLPCPCKPLGTARPLCTHRECLPGGTGTGWAPTEPPRGTGGFFLTPSQDPKAHSGPGGGCGAVPRAGEAELRQEC